MSQLEGLVRSNPGVLGEQDDSGASLVHHAAGAGNIPVIRFICSITHRDGETPAQRHDILRVLHPKRHPIPYVVYFFRPGSIGFWLKVEHYIWNMTLFGMHTRKWLFN